MENVQRNAIIECPKLGRSLEVQLPESIEGSCLVYSISGDKNNKVYLDPFKVQGLVGNGRYMVYSSDALITNGSWIQEQLGRRIC